MREHDLYQKLRGHLSLCNPCLAPKQQLSQHVGQTAPAYSHKSMKVLHKATVRHFLFSRIHAQFGTRSTLRLATYIYYYNHTHRQWMTPMAKHNEKGASIVEYLLLATLVAIGAVTGATLLGSSIDQKYSSTTSSAQNALAE